jgi:competence protein ComEC
MPDSTPKPAIPPSPLHRPLPVLAAALAGGIALGGSLPGLTAQAALLAAAAAMITILAVRRNRPALLAPLAMLAAAGYLAMHPWESPRLPRHHVSHLVDAGTRQFSAEVTALVRTDPGRQRLNVRVRQQAANGPPAEASGRIRLTVHGDVPAFSVGEELVFKAVLRPIDNFNNPGGFDYRAYMRRQGIRAAAHVKPEHLILRRPADASGPRHWLNQARRRLDSRIRRHAPPEAAGLLQALITGNRANLPPHLRSAFSRAGTGHLLAISGLHIGIVASAVYLASLQLLAWVAVLQRLALTRLLAALAAWCAVLFYASLAGWPPSTQRAVLMATAVLATMAIPRKPDTFSSIALAAVVILAIHPPALFHISFQLSFAAVAMIVLGLGIRSEPNPLDRLTPTPASPLKTWVVGLAAMTFWAMVATLPLVARAFNLVSLIGLPVNLLVVPPIGYLVVPIGLLGAMVSFASAAAGGVLIHLAGAILAPLIAVVEGAAGLPLAASWTPTPSVLEIGVYYVLAVSAVVWWRDRRAALNPDGALVPIDPKGRRGGRTAVRWAVAGALLVLAVDAGWWIHYRWFDSRLRVTFLDVGQGTATLLELPKGPVWLVDGGGFGGRSTFDVGARIVAPLLWRKKILTVDRVVLSHPNSDHLNGLLFILEHFRVKQFWCNGQPADTDGYRRLREIIARVGLHAPAFDTLPRRQRLNGTVIDLLHPPPGLPFANANNNSIVLKATLGDHSVLLPGDLMARAERALVRGQSDRLSCSLLAAPHHGSRTSSTPAFISAAKPDFVVISAGKRNRFGMPHPVVVARYRRKGIAVLRIDQSGAVTAATDGSRLTVSTALP